MKSFVAVAEELNYGRAAEVLHIAQPAVSQQVQQLEKRLGVKLFDRTTRSVRLTAAGERFLQPCKDALAGIDRAVDAAVIADPAVEGRVRVGFSGAYGQTELSSLARSVRRRYPLIDLVLEGATVSGQISTKSGRGNSTSGSSRTRCPTPMCSRGGSRWSTSVRCSRAITHSPHGSRSTSPNCATKRSSQIPPPPDPRSAAICSPRAGMSGSRRTSCRRPPTASC